MLYKTFRDILYTPARRDRGRTWKKTACARGRGRDGLENAGLWLSAATFFEFSGILGHSLVMRANGLYRSNPRRRSKSRNRGSPRRGS